MHRLSPHSRWVPRQTRQRGTSPLHGGALLALLWYRAATACRASSSGVSGPKREVFSTMPAKLWTMSVTAFSLQSCAVDP